MTTTQGASPTSEPGTFSRIEYLFPREIQPAGPAVAPLPTVEGGFACIEADPPWKFEVWSDSEENNRRIENHYETMDFDQIAALPVRDVAAPDCTLFLWITGPYLLRAGELLSSWGFKFSGNGFVWIKLNSGLGGDQYQLMTLAELTKLLAWGTGYTTRKNAEFCLIARRGRPARLANDVHEVIITPRREHSRKPDELYERIERLCAGPRLSLFSRTQRAGWTVWGNQTERFG